ncbi:MAG TPA: glycosyltransferase [Kofleriaceae bacterium]|nr:glycosyltransferase [Kofleriaceae bacterium]
MKLSLMVPTFNSAETIERTLRSVLAQRYRPLEVVIYDEASADDTRAIVRRLLDGAAAQPAAGLDARLRTSDHNSGPVKAWRVALHDITGDWCAFVWADDVLHAEYSTRMMAGAERAVAAGRKMVACTGEVEIAGEVRPYYSDDKGVASAVEFSEGMFMRRFPLTQICAIYQTATAREVFDRHVQFANPRDYDYNRHPYGNDVGYLSELALAGGGVELLGERLVTLVDSGSSMTRRGTREHVWQMRWQYTFNQLRVWRWWAERGVPGAEHLRRMGERRLALCALMLGGARERLRPSNYLRGVLAYLDFRRFDYQRTGRTLDEHRRRVAR